MIDFSNVTKRYGQTKAIDHLTLRLTEPDIYCLLGRNGAGKTTLMNLIAGKTAASEGLVSVAGWKTDTLNTPENVAYIETVKNQFNMRVLDLIQLAAEVGNDFDMDFALNMVERFELDQRKKYNSLSFGMKTMVTTLISLANGSDIVLLDEPVLGFDAVTRVQFYDLLQESFSARPRMMIVSTHLIDEIADVAGRVILIDQGKLILYEDINAINEKAYRITGLKKDAEAAAEGLNVLRRESIGKFESVYVFDKRIAPPETVEISNITLQDLFVSMIGGTEHA